MTHRAEGLRANPRVLPQSTLGKAARYLLNEYTALVGYLRDGRLPVETVAAIVAPANRRGPLTAYDSSVVA
jgi:hypothetical protein